jgi:hypothetical protein
MVDSIGMTSSVGGVYSQPSKAQEAIALGRQGLSQSMLSLVGGSSNGVSTPLNGMDSYSQMIYDGVFVKSLAKGNDLVAATGVGKTVLPYGDSKAAATAGQNALNSSKSAILSSAMATLNGGSSGTAPLLQLFYLKNGYSSWMSGKNLNVTV